MKDALFMVEKDFCMQPASMGLYHLRNMQVFHNPEGRKTAFAMEFCTGVGGTFSRGPQARINEIKEQEKQFGIKILDQVLEVLPKNKSDMHSWHFCPYVLEQILVHGALEFAESGLCAGKDADSVSPEYSGD